MGETRIKKKKKRWKESKKENQLFLLLVYLAF